MVGRTADLGVLRRLCRSASAGAGGAALVEGVAGAGKTTLLRALVDDVSDLDALWGRAPQEGGTPTYWPWREIASAAGWDVSWQGATDLWSLGAELTARIRQSARVRPLLLLVDDLHAADDDTVRMTAYLASVLRDSPVALVVAARPDERLSVARPVVPGAGPDDPSASPTPTSSSTATHRHPCLRSHEPSSGGSPRATRWCCASCRGPPARVDCRVRSGSRWSSG